MNVNSDIKFLTPEETKQAFADVNKQGVVASKYLNEYPEWKQQEVKERFALTFKDDRSAYHREYEANMKDKESKQIISDEEEERIIQAYGQYKEFQKLREEAMKEKAILEKEELDKAVKARVEWNNKQNELPDVVVNFD